MAALYSPDRRRLLIGVTGAQSSKRQEPDNEPPAHQRAPVGLGSAARAELHRSCNFCLHLRTPADGALPRRLPSGNTCRWDFAPSLPRLSPDKPWRVMDLAQGSPELGNNDNISMKQSTSCATSNADEGTTGVPAGAGGYGEVRPFIPLTPAPSNGQRRFTPLAQCTPGAGHLKAGTPGFAPPLPAKSIGP